MLQPLPKPSFDVGWTSNSPRNSRGSLARDSSAFDDVSKLPTVMNERDHRQLSDIDMERLSAISITSSEISDFSSLLSLAQRIRLGQTGGTSSGRDSVNDLPSSAMGWDRRNSSLYLFGRRSITSSIASSQKTSSSRMSWRPEIPAPVSRKPDVYQAIRHWK